MQSGKDYRHGGVDSQQCQPREQTMWAAQYLRFGLIGVAMLGAGSVPAGESPLPADAGQQREKRLRMSSEERSASREQMQEFKHNMTPQEQARMGETRSGGRTRVENPPGEGARQLSQDGSLQGGGYGQGYESRRGEVSGVGGGRGMGSGRGR